jgi:hypothetical protein
MLGEVEIVVQGQKAREMESSLPSLFAAFYVPPTKKELDWGARACDSAITGFASDTRNVL